MTLLMVPLPLRVEHLQRDQTRVGRDAGLLAVRVVAVAGDDAGDVRAVAVVVVRRHGRRSTKSTNAETRWLPYGYCADERLVRSSCHVVMPESMTATPTPAPVRPGGLIDGERADGERRPVVEFGGRPIEVDGDDGRVRGKARQHRVRNVDHVTVDDLERAGRVRLELGRKLRAGPQHHDCTGLRRGGLGERRPKRELVIQSRLWARAIAFDAKPNRAMATTAIVRLGSRDSSTQFQEISCAFGVHKSSE